MLLGRCDMVQAFELITAAFRAARVESIGWPYIFSWFQNGQEKGFVIGFSKPHGKWWIMSDGRIIQVPMQGTECPSECTFCIASSRFYRRLAMYLKKSP